MRGHCGRHLIRRFSIAAALASGMAALVGLVALPFRPPAASAAVTWNTGDVFVSAFNGNYNVYDNNGVLKQTVNIGQAGTTTGCAFNLAGDKLYTTAWGPTGWWSWLSGPPRNYSDGI